MHPDHHVCIQIIIFAIVCNQIIMLAEGQRGNGNSNLPQEMTKLHNDYRRKIANGGEGQPAGEIGDVEWDPELASMAQRFTDTCQMGHNPNRRYKGGQAGENFAANSNPDLAGMFKQWTDESANYDYNSNSGTGGVTGHYTQVVWAKSKKIGCGLTPCPRQGFTMHNLVCNYFPAGNFMGQKPYPPKGGGGGDENETGDEGDNNGGGKKNPWMKPGGKKNPWSKPGGNQNPWDKPGGNQNPWDNRGGNQNPWDNTGGWGQNQGGNTGWGQNQGSNTGWGQHQGGGHHQGRHWG